MVRLIDKKVDRWWPLVPVHGAHGFAVASNTVLFGPSFNHRAPLSLLNLDTMSVEEIVPVASEGWTINITDVFGRGERLYFSDNVELFALDLSDMSWQKDT